MEPWRRTLYLLLACQFVNFSAFSMMSPVMPLFLPELGVMDAAAVPVWAGVVSAAHWLTAAVGAPYWGALADRYGKKLMMLRAAFGLSVVVAASAVVQSVWQLLGLRFLQGSMVGFGTAAPPWWWGRRPARTGAGPPDSCRRAPWPARWWDRCWGAPWSGSCTASGPFSW